MAIFSPENSLKYRLRAIRPYHRPCFADTMYYLAMAGGPEWFAAGRETTD
jgi:hypothetical protein